MYFKHIFKLVIKPRFINQVFVTPITKYKDFGKINCKLLYVTYMTNLIYEGVSKNRMSITICEYDKIQSKPRSERQITYFCRLCRQYKIKARKAHLQNCHSANRDTVTKRSNQDLVDVIFVESK